MTFPRWYTLVGTQVREESLVDRVNRVFTAGILANLDAITAKFGGLPQLGVERTDVIRAVFVSLVAFCAAAGAAPKDDMLAADRAFAAMSIAQGSHAAFLAYMTDDVRLFTGDHPPLVGKAAVAAVYAEEEKDPAYKSQRLEWTPLEAEAAPDGMLGWTRGTWIFTAPKPGGTVFKLTGYYVTAWRRQGDGSYKFCLDIGGADKPAAKDH
jgi:ketosteroid isomerase-like protein